MTSTQKKLTLHYPSWKKNEYARHPVQGALAEGLAGMCCSVRSPWQSTWWKPSALP